MKLKRFRERSLIMGSYIAHQTIQNQLEENLAQYGFNFLRSLILLGVYFEDPEERLGPSRLATTLGFSRSRLSQEITILSQSGYIVRALNSKSARNVNIQLTSAGEKKAQELIKVFSRLQQRIDKVIGEARAEEINRDLIKLTESF